MSLSNHRCDYEADLMPGVTKRCQFSHWHAGPHTFVSDIDVNGDFIVAKWGPDRRVKIYQVTNQDLYGTKPPVVERTYTRKELLEAFLFGWEQSAEGYNHEMFMGERREEIITDLIIALNKKFPFPTI